MTQTVGDFVIERLHLWGDGLKGVFGAMRRAGDKISFIQVQRRRGRLHTGFEFGVARPERLTRPFVA
jgi:hypothetical protein